MKDGFTYIEGINKKTNKYFITRYKGDSKTALDKLRKDLIDSSKFYLFGYIITKPDNKAYMVNKEDVIDFKVLSPEQLRKKIEKNLKKQGEYKNQDQVQNIYLNLRVYE